METKKYLEEGKAILGLELGSTRIKAVLIDEEHRPIASGACEWENRLEKGIWTYDLEDAWQGIRVCYRNLKTEVEKNYGVRLNKLAAIGISGMMHGYLPFDKDGRQLAGFRTWRNTMTQEAVVQLSDLFSFNVPQRWSVAHLYQAILNREEHVGQIAFMTTLAGYVHWKLTGEKVLGIGEASGMFPIDSEIRDYDQKMVADFQELLLVKEAGIDLIKIFPKVLTAGQEAGRLTAEGAGLLDPEGDLTEGILMCPPEGDAGTGMVATNSVGVGTGNVSAGTSIFAMIVLEQKLKKVYEQLDLVTTPSGEAVAMVHCNNCTSDLNAWVELFGEFAGCFSEGVDKNRLYEILYQKALEGEKDCGGLLAYNFYSGEHIVGLQEGRPLFVRTPEASFTLGNFMRSHLYSALATLKIGMDILQKEEGVVVKQIYGHGGLFKTKGVAQSFLAAAVGAPVAVMETAGEGGPWGMALLATYMSRKQEGETLEVYLRDKVFFQEPESILSPDSEDVKGFECYSGRFLRGLSVEREAVNKLASPT